MTTSPVVQAAQTTVVPQDQLLKTAESVLTDLGVHAADATFQATALVEGELRGHPSHGIRRLPLITQRIRKGLIDVDARPTLTWRAEACLEADGQFGLGPAVLNDAISAVLKRAESTGIALATISRSSHIGMLAPYVEQIACSGFIGILLTTSEALVHAWGGNSRVVGTNPIGVGVPTGQDPLVLDMSTSQVSMGKILDYAARGQTLPTGWAIDHRGRPTTDPNAAAENGALSPFGGPKGYALAIAVESIVALLTRSSYGTDVLGTLDADHPVSKGDTLIVIGLDALGVKVGIPLLDDYLTQVRSTGSESEPVDIPGDRARRVRSERLEHGVPIDTAVWTEISQLSGRQYTK